MSGMQTNDGSLEPLPDHPIPDLSEVHQRLADLAIAGDPDPESTIVGDTPLVGVPAAFLPMTPQDRLAFTFGSVRGKNRTGSRTHKKSERQRRYERAAHRRPG